MSAPRDDTRSNRSMSVEFVERFEQAWKTAPQPDLAEYLPGQDHPHRQAILIDLVHVDMEYRWKSGVGRPVENYLLRFPELRGDAVVVVDLFAWEYEQRRRIDHELSPGDIV